MLNTKTNQLDLDLNTRNIIADLKAIADIGPSSRRIVQCNGNTLNTPYKAGLTTASDGTAYINMSSPNHGTIVYVASAEPEIYLLYKNSSGWQDWMKVTINADFGTGVHKFGEGSSGAQFTLSGTSYCGLLFLIHDNQEQYAGCYLVMQSLVIPIKKSNWMDAHTISSSRLYIPKPSDGNGYIRLLDISGSSTYTKY